MTSPINLLTYNNLHAKKKLGQNFLKDPSISEMIVKRTGLTDKSIVVEIGPGLGAITIPSAKAAEKVYAIEKDSRLVPILKTELLVSKVNNVEVINTDIFKTEFKTFSEIHNEQLIISGNLPYNISSQILIKLVSERKYIKKAVFMFQKELAERLTAQPGNKTYGRLSAVMQYCSTIRKIASIPPNCFHPAPAVDSTVIEIIFDRDHGLDDRNETFLFSVIKAAFSKRRKNLKNALSKSELSIEIENILQGLNIAEIDPTRRAETLSVEEFIRLSSALKKHQL